MKTIKQHLEELPEPWRSEAIENAKVYGSLETICETRQGAISLAFIWAESEQGYSYWHSISNKVLVSSPIKTKGR